TEGEWLAFARGHTHEALAAEVQDAIAKDRLRPREERYGLPNLGVRLVVRLTRSEHERMLHGLARVAPELSQRLGGEEVEMKDVLLYLAEWLLATEPAARALQRRPRAEPAETILYHRCPQCKRAVIHTPEGLVEITGEEIERIEGRARVEVLETVDEGTGLAGKATTSGEEAMTGRGATTGDEARSSPGGDGSEALDPPTPPALRRKLLLRDGARCSNPYCQNPADHCHHIVFRSRGGRTVPENEAATCSTCHALIHAGLLSVTGTAGEGLRWRARAEESDVRVPRAKGGQYGQEGAVLPEIRIVVRKDGRQPGPWSGPATRWSGSGGESADADWRREVTDASLGVQSVDADSRRQSAAAGGGAAGSGRESAELQRRRESADADSSRTAVADWRRLPANVSSGIEPVHASSGRDPAGAGAVTQRLRSGDADSRRESARTDWGRESADADGTDPRGIQRRDHTESRGHDLGRHREPGASGARAGQESADADLMGESADADWSRRGDDDAHALAAVRDAHHARRPGHSHDPHHPHPRVPDPEALARGLNRLGLSMREARERVARAMSRLAGTPSAEEALHAVLRSA
ncbi:MAG: HNH endonuclease, partial [Myxococcaceae bacterium]|nr:HNH endonuclease [Myxococcaceae bacterium]